MGLGFTYEKVPLWPYCWPNRFPVLLIFFHFIYGICYEMRILFFLRVHVGELNAFGRCSICFMKREVLCQYLDNLNSPCISIFQRGRHASKLTEEEEDEVYLKEEEDGLSGSGNTRLLVQPSCITLSLSRLPFFYFILPLYASQSFCSVWPSYCADLGFFALCSIPCLQFRTISLS